MLQIFREVKVKGFDASQYEAKQVFYSSKDGTRVPMFIVSKKVRLAASACQSVHYCRENYNM